MKKRVLGGILILAMLSACAAPDNGRPAPDWTLQAADGSSVNFAQARNGKTSIVLFWATWCPYCKALMPHLQALLYEYGDSIQVLAISINDDGDPAAFLEKFGYDFLPLLDGEQVAESYGVSGTPGLFVVDSRGNIMFDLSEVQVPAGGGQDGDLSHGLKAARKVPYWVARLRESFHP